MEPLVVNQENAEKAIEEGLIHILGKVLTRQDNFFIALRSKLSVQTAAPLIKLALRSLVSMVRYEEAVRQFMENINIFDSLIDIVDNSVDEEVIANSLKTIRFIFKHT